MDTGSLVMVAAVLQEGQIRAVARRLGRPPATVSAAVRRLEERLAVDLVHRAGARLSRTLEAGRLEAPLADLRRLCEALAAPDVPEDVRTAATVGRAVSIEALRRFAEVARAGSIRRAAQRLGIGQPQLTRQLTTMETVLEIRLLARGSEGCVPTDDGRRVLEIAREIDTLWNRLAGTARQDLHRRLNTVRMGSIVPLGQASPIARLLAALLARWADEARVSRLSLTSTTAEILVEQLRTGDLDVAVLDTDGRAGGLEGEQFARSRLAVVGRPGFARGRRPEEILMSEKVAVQSLRSGLRQAVARILGEAAGPGGRTPPNFVEADSIPVIVNLVVAHGYVSVLPAASLAGLIGDVEAVELDPRFDLPLWLVWQPTDPIRRFSRQILSIMAER
jgi:LysR family nitrogen assimilation transcriptional regulator